MATTAGVTSVYNANTDWENEESYLSGLAKAGNDWAKEQLNALHEAKAMYTTPSTPVQTEPAQTAPTQPVQPSVYTQPTGEYTHSLDGGKTYITGAQALAQQTGITEQQAQALIEQGRQTGTTYDVIMQQARQLASDSLYEDFIAQEYAKWLDLQDSPGAFVAGMPFEDALAYDGGLDQIQLWLQNGFDAKNKGITVTPLTAEKYADIISRVTGGQLDGSGYNQNLVQGMNITGANVGANGQYVSTGGAGGSVSSGSSVGGGSLGIGGGTSGVSGSGGNSQSALIEELYKAQQQAALAELEAAYEQNMLDLDAAAQKIPAIYQDSRNRAARDAAVAGRNFNEYAAASGLSSGAGAQTRLAMDNQLISGLSEISAQEATAMAELENQRAKTKVAYQNAVASAIAEGDLAKAEALYKEAVRMDEMYLQQAYQNAQLELQYAELERALANDKFKQELALQKLRSKSLGSPNPSPDDEPYVSNSTYFNSVRNQYNNMRANGYSNDVIANYLAEMVLKGYVTQQDVDNM